VFGAAEEVGGGESDVREQPLASKAALNNRTMVTGDFIAASNLG
jgi:hypothetical protein